MSPLPFHLQDRLKPDQLTEAGLESILMLSLLELVVNVFVLCSQDLVASQRL
jgi:NADH:ubiquinone oxidoreductase subunit H